MAGHRGRPAGRAPQPGPKCRVTLGAARPVRMGACPAPPTCAPPDPAQAGGSPATTREADHRLCGPRGSGYRLPKVAAQATLHICRDFLRKSGGSNLFPNKVRRARQPHALPGYRLPRCLKTHAQSRTRLLSMMESSTYPVSRGGGHMQPGGEGPRNGRGDGQRGMPEAETEQPTRTPARAAGGPEDNAGGPSAASRKAQRSA